MSAGPKDDWLLVQRGASGDEAAVRRLYDRYADSLFAFIYHHLGGSRPDAEEVWQDTLLAAFQSLPTYRGRSRFFTWLCGIARHKIADYYRRQGRPVQTFSAVSPQQLARLMDAGPLPEEMVLQYATRARVVEALAGLPEDYARALAARYADGYSVAEVAQLLGRTYKATESLLSRARRAFQTALARLDREEVDGE